MLGSKLCVAECYISKYAKLKLVSLAPEPLNANSSAAGWFAQTMQKYNMNGSFVFWLYILTESEPVRPPCKSPQWD